MNRHRNLLGIEIVAVLFVFLTTCSFSLFASYHWLLRRTPMEVFVSAIIGDVVSRFISFMIEKNGKQANIEEKLECLQRMLLRIHTIIEEVLGRHVTNKMMLLHLKRLIEGMYRGYYVLDTFNCQDLDDKAKDEVRHSFSLSSFNLAKRLRFATSTKRSVILGSECTNKLQIVLESLETSIAGVKEFILLLGGCPRLFRPYSTYLFMDKCMFSRHVEREQIINFLLQIEPSGAPNVSVLPIVGPHRVGKSTLIEHVCNDDRVRNRFSLIILIDGNDLESKTLTTLKDDSEIKHQKFVSGGGFLLIIESVGYVDEVAWRKFCSSTSYLPSGSKIIVVGTTEKVTILGTVQPIRLKHLSQEEYWYFFKTLAFGSMNPKEHPKLVHIAMEIATLLKESFIAGHLFGGLLRDNLNVQFWCRVLKYMRNIVQMNFDHFGEYPEKTSKRNHPFSLSMTSFNAPVSVVFTYSELRSARGEVPKVTIEDLFVGINIPTEKAFNMLVWQSSIPPYHNFIASVVKEKPRGPQHAMTRKKRLR